MRTLKTFLISVSLYTRLHIFDTIGKNDDMQKIIFNLPFVGVLIGFLWLLIYKALILLHFPIMLSAAVLAVFPHWFSGFLHIEGYMDAGKQILKRNREMSISLENITNIYCIVYFIFYYATMYVFLINKISPTLLILIPIMSRELALMGIYLMPALSSRKDETYDTSRHKEYTIILMVLFVITVLISSVHSPVFGAVMSIAMLLAFFWSYKRAKEACGVGGETMNYTLCMTEIIGLLSITIVNFNLS